MGWPGRLWLAAPEVHGTLCRTGWLMVSTHFAADPMLLPCLVLGLSAKVPAPRILPMLVLELATPFLQHGPVLGSSCSMHDPHALPQGGCRGFTAKPPCPKIAVTPQTSMLGVTPGMFPSLGCISAGTAGGFCFLVAASVPGNDTAPSRGQEKCLLFTETLQLLCPCVTTGTRLLGCPPRGAQGEVTSGSHTRWDADLQVQCSFWLLHACRFLFLTLEKWPSRAASWFGFFGGGDSGWGLGLEGWKAAWMEGWLGRDGEWPRRVGGDH